MLEQLSHFPTKPGVYLMKNREGKVLYVGKAKNLKTRLKQYFLLQDTRAMIPFLVKQTASVDTIVVPSEKEALLLENTLIKQHRPKFNAVLKDDKSFLSLQINPKEPWPKLSLVRYRQKEEKEGLYFGPYTSAFSAKKTHELMSRLFPLRQCSNEEFKRRTRPCLLYDIKRCLAPCVNKCTKEEYDLFVQGAISFLKGDNRKILTELYEEMQKASDALAFEKADALLHTIRQLEHVIDSKSLVASHKQQSIDALGLYRKGTSILILRLLFREGQLVGSETYPFEETLEEEETLLSSFILQLYLREEFLPDEILVPCSLSSCVQEILIEAKEKKTEILCPKKGDKHAYVEMACENAKTSFIQEKGNPLLDEKALLELQTLLHLSRYPSRIICFDTSHIAGSNPVASCVLFTEGHQDKKGVRLFKIKQAPEGDDYAALKEILVRYLTKAKEEDRLPDLIIVDGGKGQLNVALELLKELEIIHIDLIALTKEAGRHDKGLTQERIFLPHQHDPIHLNARSSILFFLQNIRDAAHKKALHFHQKLRKKRHLTSSLSSIPGIGPIKQKRLLQHFGSLEQIKQASAEELRCVKGITSKDIETLHRL